MNYNRQRDSRNLLNQPTFNIIKSNNIANYSSDVKTELKSSIAQEELLNRLNSIPDPLRKNLADTFVTSEYKKERIKMPPDTKDMFYGDMNPNRPPNTPEQEDRSDFYPSLTGITTFFSSVFGAISGAMFHRRAKSPVTQYYDCFDQDTDAVRERSPSLVWQPSKFEDQNKNGRAPELISASNDTMNSCRAAVAQCEDKLNAVRTILTTKSVPKTTKLRPRRTRRAFVEPGSVEESYEDAFAPDDFVSLANNEYIEYFSVHNNHNQDICEVDAPIMKTELEPERETQEIVTIFPDVAEKILLPNATPEVKKNATADINSTEPPVELKQEIILSCEDKMAKLKSLLQEKRKNKSRTSLNSADSVQEPVNEDKAIERPKVEKSPTKTIPIDKKHDKRFKNPNRTSCDKRKKSKLRKNIQEDMLFAHEVDSEEISSVENSPICKPKMRVKKPVVEPVHRLTDPLPEVLDEAKDYFNEVKGRFHSTSTTDSDDSFQIVFSDSPKLSRIRRPSDCDSEDSFIVFEESPNSCYTSNDVFGDSEDSDSDYSDTESEVSDSGVSEVSKISHSMLRTVNNLTDDSLYEDVRVVPGKDIVDCAARVCEEIPSEGIEDLSAKVTDKMEESARKPGLLIDAAKKVQRKDQPPKKVTFSSAPPKVRVMRVWAFAARQARAGHWDDYARDRDRFKRRIADADMAISWVLKPQHRSRVMFQRFMPWWNQLKRKELAEKKLREEEERLKKEAEERKIMEEMEQKERELALELERREAQLKAIKDARKCFRNSKMAKQSNKKMAANNKMADMSLDVINEKYASEA